MHPIKMLPNTTTKFDALACKLAYKGAGQALFTGLPTKYTRFHSSRIALLEEFVEFIGEDEDIPFPIQNDIAGFALPLNWAHYFNAMPSFLEATGHLSPYFRYSEHIEIFRACCEDVGIPLRRIFWPTQANAQASVTEPRNRTAAGVFNELVSRIREACREESVVRRVRNRRYECSRRFREYCRYVDALFERYARLVVLRVDFSYKKELASDISLQQATDDINHLFNNQRCNRIFKDLQGYIVKLEYGVEKKLHIHALLCFDGSTRQGSSHVYHAKRLGEYWRDVITKGKGDYWNSNARADEFERKGLLGVGPIHADDDDLRFNLKNEVIRYLTKSDQFVCPISDDKIRLIRRGNFPKRPPVKRGRPRNTKKDGCNAITEAPE